MPTDRVQKILAHAGFGSRRSCEEFITAGRVTVNGKVISLGAKADPLKDTIKLDGQEISVQTELIYIAINKPRGILSSTKTERGRKSVVDLVPIDERIYPVGRLDIESEGLMILTNDGDLANKITHPRYKHEKEYRVLVHTHPDEKQLETWRRGVILEDGYKTKPVQIRVEKLHGKGAWLRIVMTEGRKRQIRETAQQIGLYPVKLIRIRMGTVQLGGLKPGEYRTLSSKEIASLRK